MTFALNGQQYPLEPMKVDRKRVYGWSEVHAFDDDGNECQLVSTDATGTIIIPRGGISLGITTGDGRWVERSELKVVTADGTQATMAPSSYTSVTELSRKVSDEEFLDCSITAMYHLKDAAPELISAIGDDIYTFDYCYLDSYETSPAFVLCAEVDGATQLFMLVGKHNEFTFIGFEELALLEDPDSEADEESDDIDFSMF